MWQHHRLTSGSMLESEANNIVRRPEVQFARVIRLANQLLRQQDLDPSIVFASVPGALHKNILMERRELEERAAVARLLFRICNRSLFVHCCEVNRCTSG